MSKIIKAVFTGRFCTTRRVFQWDTDDKLQFVNLDLPAAYTVDFANSLTGQSVSVLATSDTVQIPPEMMTPDSEIYAWVWISDTNGGYTKCQATIPSDPRAQHPGLEPTPAQASAWDEAVDALNDAAADYETAISHAPIIQDGYWYIWNPSIGEYENTDVKAAGTDGENGNIIWWTTDHVTASGDNAGIQRRKLHGPEGLTPAVGDYVFAPAAGNEGEPTTLYVIITSTATVIMTALGRIVGPAGQDGTDGTDGQDGYSPEVTITSITGGHRVTITDEDHPSGQSFDVMDGTSGSSDYSNLTNKPSINSITLSGNKSLSDLGIAAASAIPAAATANPSDLGTAAAGSSTKYAREDHVHNAPSADEIEWTGDPLGGQTAPQDVETAVERVYNAIPSAASDIGAVAVAQGVAHAGEFFVVGSDGNATTVTMSVWQGGSY